MNKLKIKRIIDNYEQIEEWLESIPEDDVLYSENLQRIYDYCFNLENSYLSRNNIDYDSFKLFACINGIVDFSSEYNKNQFQEIIRDSIDLYGNNTLDILDIGIRNLDITDYDFLAKTNDENLKSFYKHILKEKINNSYNEGLIETLKNADYNYLTKEDIVEIINSGHLRSNEELLDILPERFVQDGFLAKEVVKNSKILLEGDEKILSMIPESEYDSTFCKEIMTKINDSNYSKIFSAIPLSKRTKGMWEEAVLHAPNVIIDIPVHLIQGFSDEKEYIEWKNKLIVTVLKNQPDEYKVRLFNSLPYSQKVSSISEEIASSMSTDYARIYKDFLDSVPLHERTPKLYEVLTNKNYRILEELPSEKIFDSMTQQEFEMWVDTVITSNISNNNNLNSLINYIPRQRMNEVVWNALLNRTLEIDGNKKVCSLSSVPIKNITPEMCERAYNTIHWDMGFNYVPCVDRNIDYIQDESQKKEYKEWISSLSEQQIEDYRNWYENFIIEVMQKNGDFNIFTNHFNRFDDTIKIPLEGISLKIINAYLEANGPYALSHIPIPNELTRYNEQFESIIISAIQMLPSIDYSKGNNIHDKDILDSIPIEYITDNVLLNAVQKNPIYLNYANMMGTNIDSLFDIAYKAKLESINRDGLTQEEKELMKRFAINNSELFSTLDIEILDSKIIDSIGTNTIEKIVRYKDVQSLVLSVSKDENALKTFGFALNILKEDSAFVEPLIEKLSKGVLNQRTGIYDREKGSTIYQSQFLSLVSQRLDNKNLPITEYEKAIISYLALNPQEGKKITSYDDILSFVERKNSELESIVNNTESTLLEVKNAYLERLVGLNYETVVNLVTMYGNDPEQLLQNYKIVSPESFKELGEKEALEIIIKLKSLIETQDINAIRSEFTKSISQERKEESFLRYQKSTILETSLRRAYGRDMVDSLSKNVDLLQTQELEFEGEKYLVRKVDGEFNRMVSLLGAYRKSSTTEGDMYDRWNTSQMATNHALCYSLINQSNPGTAMISGKTGVIISIDGFSSESVSAAAPYDLCSDNRQNTIFTWRQQRFFSAQNMPNQTRGMYSEYDIEIQDVLSESDKYQKIQPATIICFEEVDEDSIRAAIELGKKLGHPVPIELIDRRELAQTEMIHITEALNKFKTGETINPTLVGEIITRFNNVRNAHRFSNLSDELLGENKQNENKEAPFNIEHLNQMLKECLASVEQKIRSGQVQEGLEALESIKMAISDERQRSFLMPTMHEKQLWTGIDMDIDYTLDELQRTYGKPIVKPLEEIKTLKTLSQMQGQELSSVTFDATFGKIETMPEQLSTDQIMQGIDVTKIQESIAEIHSQGFYQGNKSYDEEHIARVILYSDAISKMEGFDDKTRGLLTEVAKYYSCGRQLDIEEKHEQYSAKLAGKALADRYSTEDIGMIQATIELQNFKPSSHTISEIEEERKAKLSELCSKYGISEEQAFVVSKMSSCISDSVKLDQTRFVDKAKDKAPEQSFRIGSLESEFAKKMVEFSYSMQEQLAQQEIDRLSSVAQMDFDAEKEQIMKDFFTEILMMTERKTKDKAITQSPIVRLEYLKAKYPEIIDMDEIKKIKEKDSSIEENKSSSPYFEWENDEEREKYEEIKRKNQEVALQKQAEESFTRGEIYNQGLLIIVVSAIIVVLVLFLFLFLKTIFKI